MRIAVVTGGRDHRPNQIEAEEFERIITEHNIEMIITGGHWEGVDKWIIKWCVNKGHPFGTVPACWGFHDKKAGPIRNGLMVKLALATGGQSICIAFSGGKGTTDCVKQAKKKGLRVLRIGQSKSGEGES